MAAPRPPASSPAATWAARPIRCQPSCAGCSANSKLEEHLNMAEHVPLEARHLIEAARLAQETLRPAADRDWAAKAGRCDWDCRTTLDHMVNAPIFHATNLAMRSTERIPGVRAGNPNGTVPELIAAIEHSATILARVVAEADPGARG